MLKKLWARLRNFDFWKIAELQVLPRLKMLPLDVTLVFGLMLLMLVLVLTACGTPLPPSSQKPVPATMPVLSEPLPLVPYSLSAASATKNWRNELTATSPTSPR